jgi:hypothetical protein
MPSIKGTTPRLAKSDPGQASKLTGTSASPAAKIRETSVDNFPKLVRNANRSSSAFFRPQTHLLPDRLELHRAAAARTERDVVPPIYANTEHANAARAAAWLVAPQQASHKLTLVQLLTCSALRYSRLYGPHTQMRAQDMAPMKMYGEYSRMNGVGSVTPHTFKSLINRKNIKLMVLKNRTKEFGSREFSSSIRFRDQNGVIIIHEAVHERQFGFRPQKSNLNVRVDSNSKAAASIDVNPRKFFYVGNKNTKIYRVAMTYILPPYSDDHYKTRSSEVMAYSEQSAYEPHIFSETSFSHFDGQPSIESAKRNADVLCDILARVASRVFKVKPKEGYRSDKDAHIAKFSKHQWPVFDLTYKILLCLADIEKFQRSEVFEAVVDAVRCSLERLKTLEVNEAGVGTKSKNIVASESDPVKAMQMVFDALNDLLGNLRVEYGVKLYVPAAGQGHANDADQFNAVRQHPFSGLNIVAKYFDEEVKIEPGNIHDALNGSGFVESYAALRKTIECGTEVCHAEVIKPVAKLAEYLYGKPIPLVVLNVYQAPNTEIPVVAGLTTHSMPRKIRFDPSSWQVHIPIHLLRDTENLPSRFAKIAVDVAMAARQLAVRSRGGEHYGPVAGGMIDPGEATKILHLQMVGELADKNQVAQEPPTAVVEDASNPVVVSQRLFNSLVGTLSGDKFRGAQKCTLENHWHDLGDREVLKRIKDDAHQSVEERAHAARAYRAGVIARKEAEPMLALRREFGLQAKAMCTVEHTQAQTSGSSQSQS